MNGSTYGHVDVNIVEGGVGGGRDIGVEFKGDGGIGEQSGIV